MKSPPLELNFKIHRFVEQMISEVLLFFTIQLKLATEIG